MINASEVSLADQDFKAVGLEYTGPLTEVVLWRDQRTRELCWAQPGEYIVRDTDGYARRWTSTEFTALFDTVAAPDDVTSPVFSASDDSSATFTWTDEGLLDVRIYGTPDYRGVATLLAEVANGTETWTATGLLPEEPREIVIRSVSALGAEAAGVSVTGSASPVAVPADGWVAEVLADTVATLQGLPASDHLLLEIHADEGGGGYSLVTTLDPGQDWFVMADLTASEDYDVKLRYRTAEGAVGAFGDVVSFNTTFPAEED